MPLTADQLNHAFPNNDEYGDFARFEFDNNIQRFVGEVVSREFRGLSVPDRQARIWQVLREEFGEQSQEVSLVLAFSPEEWEEIGDAA